MTTAHNHPAMADHKGVAPLSSRLGTASYSGTWTCDAQQAADSYQCQATFCWLNK